MSAPKKQVTAVEWFAEQIEPYVLNRVSIPKYILNDLKEQAKAMEKEQIVDAVDGFPLDKRHLNGEEYYSETYEKETSHSS